MARIFTTLGLFGLLSGAALPLTVPHVDVVDDLLLTGQKKLLAGDSAGALEAFEQAHGLAGGLPRTELYVLRAQLERGRRNDAVTRGEELERKGQLTEAQVDYLRGTTMYLAAEEILNGTPPGNPGHRYQDAHDFLKSAVTAAPDAYLDGWYLLASASRKAGQGETAERAVREALKRLADFAPTYVLGAEILVANGVQDLGSDDAATAEAARAKVREGSALAERAAALYGDDKGKATAIAGAHLQRGVAALWLGDKDAASAAYAEALGWDPTQADFGQLWGALQDDDKRPAPFVAALTEGAKRFERRWGSATASDATLLWWLGYGEFTLGQYEPAEGHFLTAVKKFPAYTNSWWYAGLSRYHRQDYAGAVVHWRENATASRENLVASVLQDLRVNEAILEYVIGKRYGDASDPAGTADAVFLAELRGNATPTNHKVWNNLGLFARDTGDLLARAGKEGDAFKTVQEYYELAYRGYQRANELLPGKPYYMNDWAVILHYCLDRDHQRALDLYAQATEIAERMLKQGGLEEDEKGLVQIALRDSKNNRARLVRMLEERKKREQEKTGGDGQN